MVFKLFYLFVFYDSIICVIILFLYVGYFLYCKYMIVCLLDDYVDCLDFFLFCIYYLYYLYIGGKVVRICFYIFLYF